jgi:adenylosuccinate synthase
MPISIVVGGQYGSEGKGKAAEYFAKTLEAVAAIRIGGPNSGHTVVDQNGDLYVLKHLPTASIQRNIKCVIGTGSYINPAILLNEIEQVNLNPENLVIDPQAMIISEEDIQNERSGILQGAIGSTASGTGASVIRRIRRDKSTRLARDVKELGVFLNSTKDLLRQFLNAGKRIIIEGTQGYGLSLLHSKYYPFATSRDTTAASFLSEAGLSPLDVDDIILVIRAFPIRVGGNSGPLPDEIDWKSITNYSGSKKPIIEYTSVTKRIRRVARFHPEIVREAIAVNRPTRIVLNHLDYVDIECQETRSLTKKASEFVKNAQELIDHKIDFLGFSPSILVPND